MKQAILISTGLLLTTPFIHAEKNKDKKPNVVFILADDLGYGDLSCYGQEKFETPNIDKLAQSGMRFTQCYSGTTVSAPSRSCLLTGHAQRTYPCTWQPRTRSGRAVSASRRCPHHLRSNERCRI